MNSQGSRKPLAVDMKNDLRGIQVLTYSSAVKPARSLRSAPAQKQLSTSLARINALVGAFSSVPAAPPNFSVGDTSSPCSLYSEAIELTCDRSSQSSCLDIAFRAEGRARERIRIRPEEGAGTSVTLIRGVDFEEYRRRSSLGRVDGRGRSGGRMIEEFCLCCEL
jgi:hypothetical protein